MIVAMDRDVARMEREIKGADGFWIVARVPFLTSPVTLRNSIGPLDAAVGNARTLGVEDVIISDGLSGLVSRTVRQRFQCFSGRSPFEHGRSLGRFKDARIARFGAPRRSR